MRRLALAVGLVVVAACAPAVPPSSSSAVSPSVGPSLAPSTAATASAPAIAPGTIVYEGPIPGGAGIRVVGTDGSGDRWLFPDAALPKDGWQVHPDWDRTGSGIVFAADDAEDPAGSETTRDLWVGEADGSNARRIFDCEAPCIEAEDPAWSPDGRTIAFVTWGPKPASLALLDRLTGAVTILVTVDHEPDGLRRPRWSPDGRRIVLEHQTWTGGADDRIVDTTIGIVDLDAATPEFTPITEPDLWATYPDWHPTDALIVFSTRPWTELDTGPSRLYTIRPDGSGLAPLTPDADDGARAVQPTWTPDGTAVLFTRVLGEKFGEPAMARIEADGTGLGPATGDHWLFGTHPRLQPALRTVP